MADYRLHIEAEFEAIDKKHYQLSLKNLINAPFTVIHPQGIQGVFSPVEINEILQLTTRLAA